MTFKISENTRLVAQSMTGQTYAQLLTASLGESGEVKPELFSPFRDPHIREIPPRGSVFLLLKRIAELKVVSRQFFNF